MLTRAALCLLVLLVGAPALAAPPKAEARAKQAREDYEDLNDGKDRGSLRKRRTALRVVAQSSKRGLRKFVLSIARRSKHPEDRAWAVHYGTAYGDLPTVKKLCEAVEKAKDETVIEMLAQGLSLNSQPDVVAWLAGPALTEVKPRTARAILRSLSAKPRSGCAARVQAFLDAPAGTHGALLLSEAVLALAANAGEAARPALLRAAKYDAPVVRAAAASVLPRAKEADAATLGAMRELLLDDVPRVRQLTARAAGSKQVEALVPNLIGALSSKRARSRHEAATALEAITKQAYGQDAPAWTAWWQTKKGAPSSGVTVPTYHGLPIASDRLVFVVDISGSMNNPPKMRTRRVDVALTELIQAIRSLGPTSTFNVAVFSDDVAFWKRGSELASDKARSAAIAWARKALAKPRGLTASHEALSQVFARHADIDSVFFLTDGLPTRGDYISGAAILAWMRGANRYRQILVHTIALTLEKHDKGMIGRGEVPQQMQRFMKQVADATGGQTRVVRRIQGLVEAPKR